MRTPLFHTVVDGYDVRIITTDRSDGDIHPGRVTAGRLRDRQIRATGQTWAMLDEVHGTDVVDVDRPPWSSVGSDRLGDAHIDRSVTVGIGDVGVTQRPGTHLAVWTADCAPLFVVADDGTVVGAHGGWRGLADGVLDVAVATAQRSGGRVVSAVLGPSIGPCCYEFGADDLATVAAGVHGIRSDVEGATSAGHLALDVPAAVRTGLRHHDIDLDAVGPCTGCDDRWFSHRVRADAGRHATVAVIGR